MWRCLLCARHISWMLRVAQHIMWLINLKNIFAKQLPKMPREYPRVHTHASARAHTDTRAHRYICRLVMDRNHRSMVVVKRGKVNPSACVSASICRRLTQYVTSFIPLYLFFIVPSRRPFFMHYVFAFDTP
jgi:hypothetical protein